MPQVRSILAFRVFFGKGVRGFAGGEALGNRVVCVDLRLLGARLVEGD